MHQMYSYFIHCDIVGPVHVAAMKGASYLIVYLFTEQPFSVAAFMWREREAFSFLQSTLEHIQVNAAEVTRFRKFNTFRVVTISILSSFLS